MLGRRLLVGRAPTGARGPRTGDVDDDAGQPVRTPGGLRLGPAGQHDAGIVGQPVEQRVPCRPEHGAKVVGLVKDQEQRPAARLADQPGQQSVEFARQGTGIVRGADKPGALGQAPRRPEQR